MAAAAFPPGLIDTDILIDAERGLVDAIGFLVAQQAQGQIQISAISAMELLVGSRNQQELANVLNSIAQMLVHEISPNVSVQARAWIGQFALGHGLQVADALIAATAQSCNLPLYTKNVRHFQVLPGVTVNRPY